MNAATQIRERPDRAATFGALRSPRAASRSSVASARQKLYIDDDIPHS
jgi:hypothetical protein